MLRRHIDTLRKSRRFCVYSGRRQEAVQRQADRSVKLDDLIETVLYVLLNVLIWLFLISFCFIIYYLLFTYYFTFFLYLYFLNSSLFDLSIWILPLHPWPNHQLPRTVSTSSGSGLQKRSVSEWAAGPLVRWFRFGAFCMCSCDAEGEEGTSQHVVYECMDRRVSGTLLCMQVWPRLAAHQVPVLTLYILVFYLTFLSELTAETHLNRHHGKHWCQFVIRKRFVSLLRSFYSTHPVPDLILLFLLYLNQV